MPTKIVVFDLRGYLAAQCAEINSPLNVWGTGIEFCTPTPSGDQLVIHYIHAGGADRFRAAHLQQFMIEVNAEPGTNSE